MADRLRRYLFDTTATADAHHLAAQAVLWDPVSIGVLERTGVGPGWRCLEVGAGIGTIATWLGERVIPNGRVVTTDPETEWLDRLGSPAEPHRYDITEPLENAAYDLVHTRLVLLDLAECERDAVLPKLVEAVRPGGWLVVEGFDLGANHLTEPADPIWARFGAAARQALGQAGIDPAYGRRLPAALHAAGLVDVRVEVTTFLRPVSEIGELMWAVYSRIRRRMGDLGLVSDAEIGQVLAETEDPDTKRWTYTPLLVSTCGRRSG